MAELIVFEVSDLESALALFHELKKDDELKEACETEVESEKIDKGKFTYLY